MLEIALELLRIENYEITDGCTSLDLLLHLPTAANGSKILETPREQQNTPSGEKGRQHCF